MTALKAELDGWAKGFRGVPAQLDQRAASLQAQANRIGAQFLLVDADVALTLSGLALMTNSDEKRERQSASALKAYDTIMRLRANLDLNKVERDKLDARLRHLRNELRQLGKKL